MNWKDIEPITSDLTIGLRELMKKIASMTSKDERYPALTEAFKSIQASIANPQYDIVVCGEMKKGKSSLLNAIIGQKILPVANQVATSQVFRITNSKEESFELVFNDGKHLPIEKDKLSYYGSQVEANLYENHDNEFQGRILDYIQVNIPIEFLPEGVSLIDTPGLGAIYKSHEFITRNYVRKAAAVLFVFDPERPLVDLEKDFIKKVLEVTPHIMFVMTKIDMYKAEEWDTQLIRTKESLAKLFADHNMSAPEVFPMSSVLLQEAAQEDDVDFKAANMKASMFPALKDELMHIIYKAVGLTYNSMALYESQAQIIKVRKVITDLLEVANSQYQQLDSRFRSDKEQMQLRLEQEWGAQSTKNREIADEVASICNNVVVNKVQQMFRLTGSIRASYQNKINNLNDMDEVKELCDEMPRSLANDISSQWKSIMDEAKETVSNMLHNRLSSVENMGYGELHSGQTDVKIKELSIDDKIGNCRNQYLTGMFLTSIVATVSLPLASIVAVGAVLWGLIRGKKKNDEQELQQNKNNLSQKLGLMLDELNHQLMDVQPGCNRSVVNEFVYQLKKAAEKTISETVERQKQQLRQQLVDLQQLAEKSIEEKQQEQAKLNSALNEWQSLVPTTKELTEKYTLIEKSLTKE